MVYYFIVFMTYYHLAAPIGTLDDCLKVKADYDAQQSKEGYATHTTCIPQDFKAIERAVK